MPETASKLELIWRMRSGGGGRTEQHYLDFVVDGHSLTDLCHQEMSCLGWAGPQHDEGTVQILLKQKASLLETDRVMLYVCAECGDIGCGAVTVKVEEAAEHFVWSEFGWENDYDPELPNLEPYKEVGPFLFDKSEYQQTLTYRPKP